MGQDNPAIKRKVVQKPTFGGSKGYFNVLDVFVAFKHKSFAFKVLEGIIKESANVVDMEEAQEIEEEVA